MNSARVPPLATPIVGRDRERQEIAALLAEPNCRLLTLIGPGGIGKTRLAVQTAADQHTHFKDGVRFVALTPIDAPEFLPAALGEALEIAFFGSDEPTQQIAHYLRDKLLLLVMDNFEQLLAGSDYLSTLLQDAPQLKILVTSRERLNLNEEWVYTLDGLPYPTDPTATSAEAFSAVQLFVQRARQVRPHFALQDHIQAVLSICRQVGGMPLGLELAASWLWVMSAEQIASRMASNLDFLTTSLRNVPERHRSLRMVFQQSWTLLSADEQMVLIRLALFHGGFDIQAATEVAGATLPVLAALVDKSLLKTDAHGRYDIHELLRQYAQEKLTDAGKLGETIILYVSYFTKLAETAEVHTYGHEQMMWYERQVTEMDNLRAALAWSMSENHIELGLRMAGALRWVWEMSGKLEEGLTWFKKLLNVEAEVSPSVRAKALHRASELAGQLNDEPQASRWTQEALQLARSVDDRWNIAWSLCTRAYFTKVGHEAAMNMLEESLVMFRQLHDPLGVSHALRRLAGCAIDRHNYTYASDLLVQALKDDRQADDKNAVAWELCFMGVALWGSHSQADQIIPLYEESIALFRELRDIRGSAHPLAMLAEVERSQGKLAQSHAHFRETLRLEHDLGIRDNLTIFALAGLASLAAATSADLKAARWLSVVNAALESGSYNNNLPALFEMFESSLATLRARMDGEAFSAAWSPGHHLPMEQAIAEALADDLPISDDEPTNANQSLIEPLSPRELEVLHLLGDGCSNAEIAEKLFISVATVKVHTRSIYGKLSISNRTQAILQAQKLGLL